MIHANRSVIRNEDAKEIDILDRLKAAGVEVIGRYMARCREGGKHKSYYWTKRIAYDLIQSPPTSDTSYIQTSKEADAILSKGMAIISIYQYKSNDATIDERKHGPANFVEGVPETEGLGPDGVHECYKSSLRSISPSDTPAVREGKLDAKAALEQAEAIGQPPNTPIYFAVDYDFGDPRSDDEAKGIREYFKIVNRELKRKDYLTGVYGNGAAIRLLLGTPAKGEERLVDFVWLSASPGYTESRALYNEGKWNLVHSRSDNKVFYFGAGRGSLCTEFEHDGNIENPLPAAPLDGPPGAAPGGRDGDNCGEGRYVGAWTRNGRYCIKMSRTESIFSQRKFIKSSEGVQINEPKCRVKSKSCGKECLRDFVRIGPEKGKVTIDYYDYGRFDGEGAKKNFTDDLCVRPNVARK